MGQAEHNEMFFVESQEMLDNAAFIITSAEKKNQVAGVINEVFRTFHSIKGAAQMLDFKDIGILAHMLENLLDYMRVGKVSCDDNQILSIILESIDLLQMEIYSYRENGGLPEEVQQGHIALYKRIEEQVDLVQRGIVVPDKHTETEKTSLPQETPEIVVENKKIFHISTEHNLFFVIFVITDAAAMPQVTKYLIGQRVQEVADVLGWSEDVNECALHEGNEKINTFELSLLLQTDLSKKDFKQYCNVCDVKAIYVEDLSSNSVVRGDIQPEDVQLLLDFFTELDFLTDEVNADVGRFRKTVQRAIKSGTQFVEKYCRRKADKIDWERRVRLLEKMTCLYNNDEKKVESRFILNSLVRDMWEGIYFFVNNRSYFYTVVLEENLHKDMLENQVNAVLSNSNVRAVAIDVGNLAAFDMSEILLIKSVSDRMMANGIKCLVFSSGEHKSRHINIVEAVCDDNDFRIYDSVYNAFYRT